MVVAQVNDTAAVQLKQVKEILRRYCQGLTAKGIQIYATKDLTDRGIGWSSVEQPATEGTSIFLPTTVDEYAIADHNFAHYKVLATHQAAHLEFGTFEFGFARSAFLFGNTRQAILQRVGTAGKSITDFQRFFDLFPDRKLASDLFMIVEDTRVDYLLKHEYRGILGAYERAQKGALTKRPEVSSLPVREALLEVLVQVSIENWGFFPVPSGQSARLAEAVAILRRVRNRRATVEDCAEATIRIYNLLSQTENVNPRSRDPKGWDSSNPLEGAYTPQNEDTESMVSDFVGQNMNNGGQGGGKGSGSQPQKDRREEPYRSPRPIDYRGGIKPELVQTIKRLSQKEQRPPADLQETGAQDQRESLQDLVGKSVEIEISGAKASGSDASQAITMNLLKGAPGQPVGEGVDPDCRPDGGRPYPSIARAGLPAGEDGAYLYDEWDYLRNEYKRHWCQLRQRSLDEGSGEFYADTLKTYSGLVAGVRREFERFRNERFKKVRRLPDGDEFDLDSVIEAIVEKRAGVAPSDKLYWRKNKVERDVGVALLLDMSASTYESVSGGYKLSSYMARLDEDDGERGKRIIDVEKESIVIMVEALEAIGDAYGIYCFSGHGRDNVEFYVVKDLAEELTTGVKKRIARIAPAQETRMGPAIRHASHLLEKQEYKTKILLLLSDGRPQDHDYGSHHFRNIDGFDATAGASYFSKPNHSYDRFMKDYAVYDTRVALLEARRRDIIPFCLTVDRRGHDYLKAMCGDIGYEILDDITSLPKRLPSLYRRLTT
ncbi:MAG: hypothetical protein Q7O66_12140 [Dehalococcoidia bacterium]|nr:hypothetical protein [Dehalococcoidia bacterium]